MQTHGNFFSFWKKYWPDCPYPFVLNAETKNYQSDFFNVKTVCGGKRHSWSKRLKNCLKTIRSEYVLLCLEDYFLQAPVDTEVFQAAVRTLYDTVISRPGIDEVSVKNLEMRAMEEGRAYFVPSFFYQDYLEQYKSDKLHPYNLPLLIDKADVQCAYNQKGMGPEYAYFGQVQVFRNANSIVPLMRSFGMKIGIFASKPVIVFGDNEDSALIRFLGIIRIFSIRIYTNPPKSL